VETGRDRALEHIAEIRASMRGYSPRAELLRRERELEEELAKVRLRLARLDAGSDRADDVEQDRG
jgi:hypothetical protein